MRLSELFIRLVAFGLAAVICVFAARMVVSTVEARSVEAVQEALIDNDHAFASVLGDGLQVILEGEAASEAQRFRAISVAGTMVDASRVIDNMSVAESAGIQAPDFAMEILRNDSGITIIGLVPANTDRDRLTADLGRIAGEASVADLLESADYEVPEGWDDATEFAIRALRQLPRSKISVRAGNVVIEAIADSPEEKARLETSLRQSRPTGVQLALDVSAPRPVVSPFVTRFILDDDGARFESCVAGTPEDADRIVEAAAAAGAEGRLGCTIALGSPTTRWADGVVQAIAAVEEMGGGTVTLSDADITLVATPRTVAGNFDRIAGELENRLPEVFALEAILPEMPSPIDQGPPQFIATLSPEGLVQLRGRVPDDITNMTAENFAQAKFGSNEI